MLVKGSIVPKRVCVELHLALNNRLTEPEGLLCDVPQEAESIVWIRTARAGPAEMNSLILTACCMTKGIL
jgi:hypothetical protein